MIQSIAIFWGSPLVSSGPMPEPFGLPSATITKPCEAISSRKRENIVPFLMQPPLAHTTIGYFLSSSVIGRYTVYVSRPGSLSITGIIGPLAGTIGLEFELPVIEVSGTCLASGPLSAGLQAAGGGSCM